MIELLFIALTGITVHDGLTINDFGEWVPDLHYSQFGYFPDYDPSIGYVEYKGSVITVATTASEPFDLYLRVWWY